MKIPQSVLVAAIASVGRYFKPLPPALFFNQSSSFCIPNPRNDRAAKRQRAAAKRRNKAKRG